MEVIQIPFNQLIGLKKPDQPDLGLLQLDDKSEYHNHLGIVHASAQFALAEAGSGEYLLRHFGQLANGYVPVVRRAEVKFRKPANGTLYAQAQVSPEKVDKFLSDLETRGRAVIGVEVSILDKNHVVTMNAMFEWFVQKMNK